MNQWKKPVLGVFLIIIVSFMLISIGHNKGIGHNKDKNIVGMATVADKITWKEFTVDSKDYRYAKQGEGFKFQETMPAPPSLRTLWTGTTPSGAFIAAFERSIVLKDNYVMSKVKDKVDSEDGYMLYEQTDTEKKSPVALVTKDRVKTGYAKDPVTNKDLWTRTTDLDDNLVEKVSWEKNGIVMVVDTTDTYGNKISKETDRSNPKETKTTVYTQKKTHSGVVYWERKRIEGSSDEIYNSDKTYNSAQLQLAKTRETEYSDTLSKIKQNGGKVIFGDNSAQLIRSGVTYKIDTTSGTRKETFVLPKGKTATKHEGKYFWNKDQYVVGGKAYTLSTDCGKKEEFCLRRSKSGIIALSEDQYNFMKKGYEDLLDNYDEGHNQKNGIPPSDTQRRKTDYYNAIESKTRSQITSTLNAYVSELLGPFSNGIPAGICGDSMYKKKTEFNKNSVGIPVPSSTYESEKERDIYNDLRTVIVFGEVRKITESLFRYEVTLKLISDESAPKWELYFQNSCDKTISDWSEEGQLSYGQIFQMLYAGQEGDDMIFDCGEENCKFDEACLKLSDEGNARCFKLAGDATC